MVYLNFDMEQSMGGKIEGMIRNDCSVVDDHIVPYWSCEPAQFASYDPHNNSPQETLNDVGRNMHSRYVTEPVLMGKEETNFSFLSDQSSVMQECSASSRGATNFSKQSEKNFNCDIFSSALPNLGEISAPDVNNNCVFPLDQILQVDKLVYRDLADIGNYKDLDMTFRNSPMIEQQSSAIVDNISWPSSTSNIVCSSSGTLKVGLHSASRKLGIMNSVPNQNSANTNPLSDNRLLAIDLGKDHSLDSQSRSLVNDAENRTESEEKINKNFQDLEWQFSAEEKSNGQPSELPDSQSNWHNIHPHGVPMKYNFPLCQTQLAQIESSIESEKDNNPSLSYEALVHATSCSWQYTDLLPDPMEEKVQKQSLGKPSYLDTANAHFVQEPYQKFPSGHAGEYDVGNAKMELLGCEMETPTISEASSIASTLSNDDLLKVVSFQQLKDVLCQLDHKAKQCIRDGLHRMARRTEKKNCFMNSYDDTADHTTRKGANDIEFHQIMDVEADTNLIDRSVALFLFQKSSGPDTSASRVAAQDEFHDAMSAILCSSESFQRYKNI